MGNAFTLIGLAYERMKDAIIGLLVDVAAYVIDIIIEILDAFWKATKKFLKKCKDRIEKCRPSEKKAIKQAMLETSAVMNADLKERLQTSPEISAETKKAMGTYVDEFTKDVNSFAAAA